MNNHLLRFFLLCMLLNACSKKEEAPPPMGPPSVTAASPLVESIIEWQTFTGRLDSVEDVEVRARVSGYLEKVHYDDGEIIKKDDLLFTIDQRPFKAEVSRAEAAVAQSKAALKLAKSNLKRANSLIKENAISQQDFDLRLSESEQAVANVQVTEAALTQANLDLGFTEIRAPIQGVAGEPMITEGNLISGGSATSTLLTTIVPHRPIYAYFEIDEASALANVRRVMEGKLPGRGEGDGGLPVEMQLKDESGFPHMGYIDFVDNRLDRDTATLSARARFENKDRFLTPGLFARVRMQTSEKYDAVLIPDAAIGTMQSIKYVWVVTPENKAERRVVVLGPLHESLRIVRSGLEGNEKIVITGLQMVRPGSPLNVTEGEIKLSSTN